MNKIKYQFLLSATLPFIAVLALFPIAKVSATGSALFTVEPSATSVQTGENIDLNVYVTASEANLNSAKIEITLTNAALVGYDAAGTDFGLSVAPRGDFECSTNFEVVGAFFLENSKQGKLFLGKVTVQAGSVAGTAIINLTNPEAVIKSTRESTTYMTSSVQNSSFSVVGPSLPDAECISQPGSLSPLATNPNSNIALPPDSNNPNDPAQVISLQELAVIYEDVLLAENSQGQSNELVAWRERAIYAGLGIVGLGVVTGLFIVAANKLRARRKLNSHVSDSTFASGNARLPDVSVPSTKLPSETPRDNEPIIIKPNDT